MTHVWVILGIEPPKVEGGTLLRVARFNGRVMLLSRRIRSWALEYDEVIEYNDEKAFKQWGCQKAARCTAKVLKGLKIKMPEQRADWREHS